MHLFLENRRYFYAQGVLVAASGNEAEKVGKELPDGGHLSPIVPMTETGRRSPGIIHWVSMANGESQERSKF